MNQKTKTRCAWVPLDKEDYVDYHDQEWGRPVYDDTVLFEFLILEGAQAGLSWYTILKRRADYKKAFKNFNVKKVAKMSDRELEIVLTETNVIRNRLKVFSVRKNAQVFLCIQKEYGSFSDYLWSFVNSKPMVHHPKTLKDVHQSIPESIALSNDLKKRGMSFVGGTIMYAYMQAVGLVNDHMQDCYLSKKKK